MGNGEWGMGNGEWGMGNGEWGMGESGRWGRPDAFGVDVVDSQAACPSFMGATGELGGRGC